jgi:hypothetical protein
MNQALHFHNDENGDWSLIRTYGELVVRHERFGAERAIEHMSLGRFLSSQFGPEQQKLLYLIGTLLDRTARKSEARRPRPGAPSRSPAMLQTGSPGQNAGTRKASHERPPAP